jgi:hypothetical protein
MTDPKKFVGTNRVTFAGETTRRFWVGPLTVGTLVWCRGQMPRVQVIRGPLYVGISGFGFFASVSR